MPFFKKRPHIKGHFEGIAGGYACGWAYEPDKANSPLKVEIIDGEQVVAVGLADQFRQDMLDQNFGDGHHAFRIPIDPSYNEQHALTAREANTGQILPQPLQLSVLAQAKSLIASDDQEAAIALLKKNLYIFPDNQSIADTLLDLLGYPLNQSHLPGNEQLEACEKSRRLLDIVMSDINMQF